LQQTVSETSESISFCIFTAPKILTQRELQPTTGGSEGRLKGRSISAQCRKQETGQYPNTRPNRPNTPSDAHDEGRSIVSNTLSDAHGTPLPMRMEHPSSYVWDDLHHTHGEYFTFLSDETDHLMGEQTSYCRPFRPVMVCFFLFPSSFRSSLKYCFAVNTQKKAVI
jgi:hypothetical protein